MRTRSKAAPAPGALFDALLSKSLARSQREPTVARLLERAHLQAHELQLHGPAGLTVLHAALLGGAPASTLPPLAAAGAPLNQPLSSGAWGVQGSEERAFFERQGYYNRSESIFVVLQQGYTPLAMAARMGNEGAVRALLQLGADPEAGSHGETAMSAALAHAQQTERSARGDVLALLLQAGGDCLRPAAPGNPDSLLLRAFWRLGALVLPALEQRRAAVGLELSSKYRAEQLLLVATQHGHVQLARHAIQALERLLLEEETGGEDAAVLATALRQTVDTSHVDVPAAERLAVLQALLSSALPLDLAPEGHDLVAAAARQPWGPAMVPLLHAAGAPLSLAALLQAVQALDVEGAAALLAYGRAAVDTSQPSIRVLYGSRSWEKNEVWSDPIHSVLQRAAEISRYDADCDAKRGRAMRLLELLLAAGYAPAVYHGVPPRAIPAFLRRGLAASGAQGTPATAAAVHNLDPFDHHIIGPQHGQVEERLVFLARGGSWSPAAHCLWPPAFRAAAQIVLLAACRTKPAAGRASCWLGALPPDVLLHVLSLAAVPMSAWL